MQNIGRKVRLAEAKKEKREKASRKKSCRRKGEENVSEEKEAHYGGQRKIEKQS